MGGLFRDRVSAIVKQDWGQDETQSTDETGTGDRPGDFGAGKTVDIDGSAEKDLQVLSLRRGDGQCGRGGTALLGVPAPQNQRLARD